MREELPLNCTDPAIVFDHGHHKEQDILIEFDFAWILHEFKERKHFHLNCIRVRRKYWITYKLSERVPTFGNNEISGWIVLCLFILLLDHPCHQCLSQVDDLVFRSVIFEFSKENQHFKERSDSRGLS